MLVSRTVTVEQPVERVFAYISDFTTTTDWDPGTLRTVRTFGDGGVGTRYQNTSRFLGRTTELTYTVTDLVPDQRIQLRGENRSVVAEDTMTLAPVDGGTTLTYRAEFSFKGLAAWVAPLLRPALNRLGDAAEVGLRQALEAL